MVDLRMERWTAGGMCPCMSAAVTVSSTRVVTKLKSWCQRDSLSWTWLTHAVCTQWVCCVVSGQASCRSVVCEWGSDTCRLACVCLPAFQNSLQTNLPRLFLPAPHQSYPESSERLFAANVFILSFIPSSLSPPPTCAPYLSPSMALFVCSFTVFTCHVLLLHLLQCGSIRL